MRTTAPHFFISLKSCQISDLFSFWIWILWWIVVCCSFKTHTDFDVLKYIKRIFKVPTLVYCWCSEKENKISRKSELISFFLFHRKSRIQTIDEMLQSLIILRPLKSYVFLLSLSKGPFPISDSFYLTKDSM